MIQEIYPHKLKIEYMPLTARPEDSAVCYKDGKISAVTGDEISLCKVRDFHNREFIYLFKIDGISVFGVLGCDELPDGAEFINPRQAMNSAPSHIGYALLCAYHLLKWYDETRYCPKCGKKLCHSNYERAMVCGECGTVKYPTINPCVIVGVLSGDKILLTKYAGRDYSHYRLVAGFCEFGETIEECCHREVFEETGLRIKNLKYYKCQPWAMSQSLLFGFYAELDGSERITLDTHELAVGEWKSVYEIKAPDPSNTLTQEMMCRAKDNLYK